LIPVLFHPDAETELDRSITFYEERQAGLGVDFQREVLYGVSQIHNAPTRWPRYKYGTRKYLLNRFPFHIFYIANPDCIWIVAVAHCSRKPDYWKERME
jgi:hypothetical protein